MFVLCGWKASELEIFWLLKMEIRRRLSVLCIFGSEYSASCKLQVKPVTFKNTCAYVASYWLNFVNHSLNDSSPN